MRDMLAQLNQDIVKQNPDYVVRITGSDEVGKSKLDYFRSTTEKYPVIATTSKLLSTGADIKMTKLIVLDEMIGSMTEFKQILGRGTRPAGKRGQDPFRRDGFPQTSPGCLLTPTGTALWRLTRNSEQPKDKGRTCPRRKKRRGKDDHDGSAKLPTPIVDENGCKVRIIQKTVSIYDTDGKLLRQESIIDYTKENILAGMPLWTTSSTNGSAQDKKEAIRDLLRQRGIDLEQVKAEQGMTDVDDFDFICHVAFDKKPLTRRERANNVKKRDFLSKYSGAAYQVLEALLDKYCNIGYL